MAAALLGVLLLLVVSPASAQTITNTASAQWRVGDLPGDTDSNEVVIEVVDDPVIIDTFLPTPGTDVSFPYTPTLCGNQPLAIGGGNGTGPSPLGVTPTDTVRIGDILVFRVTARAANRDPSSIDSIVTTLTTPSGDEETVTIFETGDNTGEFVGAIRTAPIPPQPVAGDCLLSVHPDEDINVEYRRPDGVPIVVAVVGVLADPYGFVFDSQTGQPVTGARVTLVDAATGQPATVFAYDGVTPWPSTMISGQPVTDAAGNVYEMEPGEFRFPLAPLGTYRIVVEPPAPYTAPSEATPAELAAFSRPDGDPYVIVDGSYGAAFSLATIEPVRLDIPLDRPDVLISLDKTASRPNAMPGDAVFYTVTVRNQDTLGPKFDVVVLDTPSPWLRLRRDSVRVDGEPAPDQVEVSDDGRTLSIRFDEIAAGASHVVRYAMVVRADAVPGNAENLAVATDRRGDEVRTSASIRIERETIGSRMTLIGRITEGPCTLEDARRGIPGVRVMLEDGSFAITDADGRYHFEGLMPGTHVVQAQRQTLPEGGEFIDCARSTANAGAVDSRFVRGQGGSLVVADFYATLPTDWAPPSPDVALQPLGDAEAAGAETDWLALGDGPADFLFPEVGHNPRAPAVRIVIRHEVGQKVELRANGRDVDPLSFDGVKKAASGSHAVSIWRGIALHSEATNFTATIRNADGSVSAEIARVVNFAAAPARAELLLDRSNLVADGKSNPVIAVRITDRKGRPVRTGVSGSVAINAPYESAQAIELAQSRQLSGLSGAAPSWTINGDDGVALIELAPTMVSGPLHLGFTFSDGQTSRTQEIESWIVPGDQEWTLVGLAEGSVGARSIADNMERAGRFDSDLGDDARVAFYAKGRILGKFLLTAAYDSAKQRDEERLTGAIDPNAYYTVFADGSVRRFDAASREKLYVRVETSTFYAIYGDFVTGFDQTQLARYNRAATGVKAEGRFGAVHVQGFATETETRFRRDEIQGNGLSGPYRLSSRAIVANSEKVTIEVRDRFRSELIVSSRTLERFIDYDIDLLSGTIRFSAPVLSRDFDLNPQFIVIEYEIDELAGSGEWNAGVRADVTMADGNVRLGATAITDKGDGARTDLAAVDARVRIGTDTEVRAEVAASKAEGETSAAWLVEAEHHSGDVDVLAYARSIEAGFGTGQQSNAEVGRRKVGVDARYRVNEAISLVGSAWRDDSLVDDARRDAVQLQASWRGKSTDLRLGIARFADRYADGTSGASTVLEGGVTQRLLNNRLELSAATSIALEGTDSIDLPTRHRFGARYAITNEIRAITDYEIASGDAIDARTLKGGFEVSPWNGARVTTTLGRQDIAEYGKRSFAAFGLAQSFAVTENLSVDATVDHNRQIGGVDFAQVINPAHPAASGGHLGQNGELFEDFTAATLGASWRKDRWAATARGEYRDGEFADRKGLIFGAIRQLGEGSVVGSGLTWTEAEGENGATSEIMDAAISFAHRPDNSRVALLGKLEYRSDKVTGAIAGETGPAGRTALTVTGHAESRRLMASLSTNWSPRGEDEDGAEGFFQRSEFGLFLGGRYNFDRFDDFDLAGFTALVGVDARIGVGERFEIGGRATMRSNVTDGYTSFAFGPEIGFTPTDNVLLSVGYNIEGFRDRDYSAARNTDQGLYATIRMKLDADSFSFLGLGRR
ncbi:hypothetical protein K3172_07920 [Qipengyuania sp. 6B39]|uniref:hypothetical protein n=1 Tax=Qipengyuania proteolytica TaxID=2867239 RepID=UPI001C8AAAEE|nr:hypothetical protein [Qipengyuania proteolytica]MBX7495782.1 hypothetical protein [Qipengyuania proteolytica]